MSKQWRVYRIGPSASGEGAISIDAGLALETLANELAPDTAIPGWVSVSFENQRGIEAAISGERLGPRDVRSCPQLPHFAFALRELETLHTVNVAGASGSGKSITVWQLADHYNQNGWHVIRPGANIDATNRQRVNFVSSKRWPTVVVVDDTQFQADDFLESLRELADDRTKVIFGTTDANWERQNTIRVSASASVKVLAETLKARRNEILPIVQRFDSHIGDDFHSMRIEDRIDAAERSETPWLFAYALRGGWRQTRQVLNAARDFDQNDLLLITVAIRQLASLDAGCTMEQLASDARTLGFDPSWAQEAVKRFELQRALLVSETIRCLHLQAASAIVELSFEFRKLADSQKLIDVARDVLSDPDTPMRGISWLMHDIRNFRRLIYSGDVKSKLVTRCFNSHSHIERRDACFVLAHLLGWRDTSALELLTEYSRQIQTWIVEVNHEDANGIASLINNLHNDDKELCERFLSEIDPSPIAQKLACLDCDSGYAWGDFLSRLSCGSSQEWAAKLGACLPRGSILEYAGKFAPADLGKISEFIHGIAGFDFEFALDCLERSLSVYSAEFKRDSLAAYRKSHELEY